MYSSKCVRHVCGINRRMDCYRLLALNQTATWNVFHIFIFWYHHLGWQSLCRAYKLLIIYRCVSVGVKIHQKNVCSVPWWMMKLTQNMALTDTEKQLRRLVGLLICIQWVACSLRLQYFVQGEYVLIRSAAIYKTVCVLFLIYACLTDIDEAIIIYIVGMTGCHQLSYQLLKCIYIFGTPNMCMIYQGTQSRVTSLCSEMYWFPRFSHLYSVIAMSDPLS